MARLGSDTKLSQCQRALKWPAAARAADRLQVNMCFGHREVQGEFFRNVFLKRKALN